MDPDQLAPSGAVWSGFALFTSAILSETLVLEMLGHLWYSQFLHIHNLYLDSHNSFLDIHFSFLDVQ